MRAKMNSSTTYPSSGMQLAGPRPITDMIESLPFTKSVATAFDTSSRAVGPKSGSSGDGRHAAVARKRWKCCNGLQWMNWASGYHAPAPAQFDIYSSRS